MKSTRGSLRLALFAACALVLGGVAPAHAGDGAVGRLADTGAGGVGPWIIGGAVLLLLVGAVALLIARIRRGPRE